MNSVAQQPNSLYRPLEKFDPKDLLWLDGKITFKNGQTYSHKIAYNQQFDVVYIDVEGEIKTLNAKMLSGFSFKEPNNELVHVFGAYPEQSPSGYIKERFLEQLVTGYCHVVRLNVNSSDLKFKVLTNGRIDQTDESEYYFFVNEKLIEIKRFIRQIYDVFPLTKSDIDQVIEENKLNLKFRPDQLALVLALNEKMTNRAD